MENRKIKKIVAQIKKLYQVHQIRCECCDKKIPCPQCAQTDLLRGWLSKNRTLAVCYYCGTVFYCDNGEIVTRLTDDRNFWGAKTIYLAYASSNLKNNHVVSDFDDLILEIMAILKKYREKTFYVIIDSFSGYCGEFSAVEEHNNFINSLKHYLAESNLVNIIIKTICENNIIEIRSIVIKIDEIFIVPVSELKYAYTHDYLTGEKITPPKNYRFKDF